MSFEIELSEATYRKSLTEPVTFIYTKNERAVRLGDEIVFRNKETQETSQVLVTAVSQNDRGPLDSVPIPQYGKYCLVSVIPLS